VIGALVALLLHVAPTPAQPAEVAARIRELQPRIEPKRAQKLAKAFVAAGLKNDLDPQLLVSIAYVESRFRPGLEAHWINRGQPTVDRGLMQVNQVWIEKWHLDPTKLRDDDTYNVFIAARILKNLKLHYTEERNWFSRYNSSWPPARTKYEKVLYPKLPPYLWAEVVLGPPESPDRAAILVNKGS
jgi:soluble lytic murein transglycosylase-like protein